MKKFASIAAFLIIFTSMAFCAGAKDITLSTMTCWVGANSNAKLWTAFQDLIRTKYAGKIKLEIEEVPGTGSEMTAKLRTMIMSKQFPDFVFADSAAIVDEARKAGLAIDMKDYIKTLMPELYKSLDENLMRSVNYTSDGWYGVSASQLVCGYFYNKEMFAKAGIKPAKTWEEWFSNADMLKSKGFIPFSMMGTEGGWTTDLYLFNMVNTLGSDGHTLCNTRGVEDYSTPSFIKAAEYIQRMYKNYTTPDAAGCGAAQAGAYFLAEKTAILANGSWYTPNFYAKNKVPETLPDRIGWAIFPYGSAMRSNGSPWMVSSNLSPEKKEAAMKVIAAICGKEGQEIALRIAGVLPTDVTIDISKAGLNGINSQVVESLKDIKTSFLNVWSIMPPALNATMSQQLQALASGDVSPVQFAANLTKAAKNLKK